MNYRLKEILVDPSDLLLDPNNPRLRKDAGLAHTYSDQEIADSDLQRRLLRAMQEKEHEVAELSESIRHHGYLNIDSIFVHRLPNVGKFLVIEGNRRTTAIKLLLQDLSVLSDHTRSSLEKIPVKELITPDGRPSAEITELIMAIRHIYGVKEWQPMQRAHTIYRAYMRILAEDSYRRTFQYESNWAAQVGQVMNLSTKSVRKALMIYRVFHQLQDNGYPVRSDHFSLIDMAVSNRTLSTEFFHLDKTTFELSAEGAERFFKLCIEEKAPVQNPVLFRTFAQIAREGTMRDVEQVVENEAPIDAVFERILRRQERKTAAVQLEQARELLQGIEVSDIRGTTAELREADRIEKLISRLRRAHADAVNES
jgi:hypothetical protein